MNLRPYQQTAHDSAIECLREHDSTLVVKPTGTGKTVVLAHIIKTMLANGGRAMVTAHREELIRQAADKIYQVTGEKPDVEMADDRADAHIFNRSKVVVSSVQTLITGRMHRFDPSEFKLLITDEAHHAPAASYMKVYKHMLSAGCKHLGVTATPDRADEEALGKVFASVAFVYELPDAIRDGWLTPIRQHMVHVTGLNYADAKTAAGDFNQADIARAQSSERILQQMCHPIVDIAAGRKTIVFATPGYDKDGDYHIAERMEEIFNRHQPGSTIRVSQDTPKDVRRQILIDFKADKFQRLLNVGVFTEGFDEDSIRVVAITRPTKSRSLFAQMVGRGTRPLSGLVDPWEHADDRRQAIADSRKPHLEVLDFVGNAGKHKLITTADILGGKYSDEVVARAKEKAEKGESVDVAEALEESMHEIHREKERRRAVLAQTTFTIQRIDPFNVFDIEPQREYGWNKGKPASPNQKNLLSRFGVDLPPDLSFGAAGQLIEECIKRRDKGKVNYAQAKQLRSKGVAVPQSMTAAEAAVALGDGDKFKRLNAKWQARMGAKA